MTYVCADIHGNLDAFKSILDQINLQTSDDLYILGDVIDRGKDGIRILQWVMGQPNVHMLLGNHEYMMLDALGHPREDREQYDPLGLWYYNGGKVTHNAFKKLEAYEREQIVQFLSAIPIKFEVNVEGQMYHLVHASDPIIWQGLSELGFTDNPKEYFCVWDRDYTDVLDGLAPIKIIFGHTPTINLQPDIEPMIVYKHENIIGIDCGAAYPQYGGRLACIRLEDEQIFYSRG